MLAAPILHGASLSKFVGRAIAIVSVLIFLSQSGSLYGDDTGVGPNLMHGDFESGVSTYNPWAGVDDTGNLHVWAGTQFAVSDSGAVEKTAFGPSEAVVDLNGDGLPDLVVADARGFFWYFANSGKLGAPVFTHGEVMPIWLDDVGASDVVPRIQMLDFTGDKKFGVVAGNYAGQLYLIHNLGSATAPAFQMPRDYSTFPTPTHTKGLLWCNYLSPFLYDWGGNGLQQRLDLILGDGTYSANSIYLFTNQGSNDQPVFNEQHEVKIIPGMGREHLTPQVVDWNNDGKPDIIAGERTGYINVYLNQAATSADPPAFDMNNPLHIMFGTTNKVGTLPTVCVAHLGNNKLFDLVIGTSDGRICYSLNTGTPGNPQFGPLIPFKGVNPYKGIITPYTWTINRYIPYGAPYELLECTNAKIEPGFTPPPEPFKGLGAMKFSMVKPNNKYFPIEYYPAPQRSDGKPADLRRTIGYTGGMGIETDTRYTLTFWAKCQGTISEFTWEGWVNLPELDVDEGVQSPIDGQTIGLGDTWTRVSQTVEFRSQGPDKNIKCGLRINLVWKGDGTLYLDDFSLKKAD